MRQTGRKLLLVGGCAGVGKSTAVSGLAALHQATPLRIHESFFRVAAKRHVPRERAFDLTLVPETEVWDDFIERLNGLSLVAADCHFAIQSDADSRAALAMPVLSSAEPFEPALVPAFLKRVQADGYSIYLVVLFAPAEVLLQRVLDRDGLAARYKDTRFIEDFLDSERRFASELSRQVNRPLLLVDTDSKSASECVAEIYNWMMGN